jgi:hypothetical protein
MRRALIALALVLVACHHSSDAPKNGTWFGDTTQGKSIQFTVERGAVTRMQIRLDLACERSKKEFHIGIRIGQKQPIRDGRFGFAVATPGIFFRFAGAFTASGNANGQTDFVVPLLDGKTVETLTAEKCGATGVGWAARPGKRQDVSEKEDLLVTIDENGAVSTSTPSATTGL